MRNRKDITSEIENALKGNTYENGKLILFSAMVGILLDIRDLLANPPVEISGPPLNHP